MPRGGDDGRARGRASSSTVLHVDDDLVVVDKPAGLVVHPARGHASGTLVNGLLARGFFRREDWAATRGPDGEQSLDEHVRPGIVHRLDKGTSGVMVVARTAAAREALKAQFQAHSIERAYEAHRRRRGRRRDDRDAPRPPPARPPALHDARAARQARRDARARARAPRWRDARRVHARDGPDAPDSRAPGRERDAGARRPALRREPRDPGVRAVGEALGHQALHARLLGFVHPRTGLAMRFDAPPPADFARALAELSARQSR